MKTVWQGSALALIFSAVSSLCQAQGAVASAQAGSAVAQACQACHGAAGEGMTQMGSPRLAGLGSSYLRRQLDAFADGTRANALMMPIAKALSPADRAAVADYFAAARLPSVGGSLGRCCFTDCCRFVTRIGSIFGGTAHTAFGRCASCHAWPVVGAASRL